MCENGQKEDLTMPDHPSGDNRFKMLDVAMRRHQFKADALLEVLHTAQEIFGYLQDDLLLYIARGLKQPPSRVYGVATFYHFFTFTLKGAHTCVVCLGTACYVKGAGSVASALEKTLAIPSGQTRADGKATLQTARCFGACGLAPAVIFDGQVAGNVTAENAVARVKGWLESGTR
jgi:bidirectional [NiFe] hydrogenase diaphorase subunit